MTPYFRRRFGVLALTIMTALALVGGFGSSAVSAIQQIIQSFTGDADLPPNLPPNFDKAEYLRRRGEQISDLRGLGDGAVVDPLARGRAITEMNRAQDLMARMPRSSAIAQALAAWTALGPAPIPNGQTTSGIGTVAVSGRTTAIAVHPTNPNIVYVGTAQGGLYRTTDGGVNWTPLMDNALSLAIGAVAIAPSQPDTVYVGTGETAASADSFFGVGLYRIDNASTASPVITGPLNHDASQNDVFSGRGIGAIVVHPTSPGTIFLGSGSGVGGIGGTSAAVLPARGLFRARREGSPPTRDGVSALW